MPRGDGTGPEGKGPMTGRGAGPCGNNDIAGFAGAGRGRGRGSGFVVVVVGTEPDDELAEPLRAKGFEVHAVGDAAGQQQVMGAVGSAWQVA